jgi:hypothetical protein
LSISSDGKVEGRGYDNSFDVSGRQKFTLKDARVEDALLSATKIFENGETEQFEAVFSNRIVTAGKNSNQIENRASTYGLGFIQTHAGWSNRVFLELR